MVRQGQARRNTRIRAVCKVAQPRPCCCPDIALSVLQVGRATHNHYLAAESTGSRWKLCSSLIDNALFSWRQWTYIKGAFIQEKKQGEKAHQLSITIVFPAIDLSFKELH
ncbi:hypothetical protein PIB30_036606 [Stylosanthes scabra]|uniref:Uncharacterized protein n=1 Tax=Stylosanthes scabra TaxID=79078 RepID=A0ABU6RDI6_9FABA|nr:hypothetical protein [Stylosanthes scabra]